jgi:hypothetical protein
MQVYLTIQKFYLFKIKSRFDVVRKTMVEIRTDRLFENIVETIREPLLVLNSDLKVVSSASRSFYEFFKVNLKRLWGSL